MKEAEIFKLLNSGTSKNLRAQLALAYIELDYDEFVEQVYAEFHRHLEELENDAEQLQNLDEDSITGNIIRMFNANKVFKASAQTYQGGAVDLTIELQGLQTQKNHKWIAEAKILTSTEKVFEGFLQLITRYVKRDLHAGLLIYVFAGNFLKRKNSWESYLADDGGWNKYVDTRKEEEYRKQIRDLISTNKFTHHDSYYSDSEIILETGNSLKVRHFFCNCIFNPMDKSGSTAKKHRKNQAMHMLESMYHQHIAADSMPLDINEVSKALSLLFREP